MNKSIIAITIQGILFGITSFCAAYFGVSYYKTINKENVNILNLSGHTCIAKIKNNSIIEFRHNSLNCAKCQRIVDATSPRAKNGPIRTGNGLESNVIGAD